MICSTKFSPLGHADKHKGYLFMILNFLVVYDKISIALFYIVHYPGGDNMAERKMQYIKEKPFQPR